MSEVLEIKTETNTFVIKGRPCEISAYSFIPKQRTEPPERTVFNSTSQSRFNGSAYDRLFHGDHNYNNKLHRDDREHAKSRGLKVNDEEKVKSVPSLASSECGHRVQEIIDPPDRQHVRIAHVQSEFYRRNGINVKPPRSPHDC